ncbi:MAG TPA: glycosyltransferase family 39 protein [Chloroflexota bacterium]|nr:glycosyltransferase family 39 protein [Chloroflexota bacterium]
MIARANTRFTNSLFVWRNTWLALLLFLLFFVAGGIRLYNIQKPFVGLLPVREFRSAIIARDIYYSLNSDIPAWQREVTQVSRDAEWSLEPPVLESLTAVTYRLFGGEQLWIPRFYATLFWLIGGFIFWKIARDLYGVATAVILTTYYLFVPIGIIASKSFQPDTLMMMFYLASLWTILRYDQEPTRHHLTGVMLASGLTLVVRPLCLFAIFSTFTALYVYRYLQGESRPRSHLALFYTALLVGLAYYVYGLLVANSLDGQAEITFQPHLLRLQAFWKGWTLSALNTITPLAAGAALLGLALISSIRLRWFLASLWGSYVIFGLIFNYHVMTHSYYHLQLIPTIALSAGPFIAFLWAHIERLDQPWWRIIWISGIVLVFVLLSLRQIIHRGRWAPYFESPEVAAEIATHINHSTQLVYLSPFYGRPLEYFGLLSGIYWPRPDTQIRYMGTEEKWATVTERLANIPFTPDYFIITDFREYTTHHQDLAAYLQVCPLVAQTESYLIYEYCEADTGSH